MDLAANKSTPRLSEHITNLSFDTIVPYHKIGTPTCCIVNSIILSLIWVDFSTQIVKVIVPIDQFLHALVHAK